MGTRFFKKKISFISFGSMKGEPLDDIECSLGAFAHASMCEDKFLNIFSDVDMYGIFEQAGLLATLKARGYGKIVIDIDRNNDNTFYLKVYNDSISAAQQLIDLRMSESKFTPENKLLSFAPELANLDMIVMEWLSTSCPGGTFTARRPQLPGQKTPGLGVLANLFTVMDLMGGELKRDGFMDVPDHFHNAVFYSKKFRFIDPAHQGIFQALLRDLGVHPLHELSWGFVADAVLDSDSGEVLRYNPSEQVFPLSERMKGYFNSAKYAGQVRRTAESKHYRLDRRKMKARLRELLKTQKAVDL